MTKRILFTTIAIFLYVSPVFAHYVFLSAEGAAQKRILISTGHAFPHSEVKLSEGLIKEFYVSEPGDTRTDLKPAPLEKALKADYSCRKEGMHIVTLRYKPNFMDDEPSQFAHTVFFCGSSQGLKEKFITGEALQFEFEGRDPSYAFAALYNKVGVRGRMELFFSDGKSVTTSMIMTDKNGKFSFVSRGKGIYMLSLSHKGHTVTVTFREP